jgi:iron(III) transport system substrate-binding protein
MTKKLWISISLIIIISALFAVFIYRSTNKGVTTDENRLVVVSPHPTEFMIPLIQEFENETGISVEVISCGTTEAIDSIMNNADIDVLWGGSLLAVGPYKDCFSEYETLNRAVFMEDYKNVEDEFTCFSNVPSVLMVNKDIIGDVEVNGYADLLKPELKGQIAFADPEKSSSAFEHLVNMLYAMGDGNPDNGWNYVKELVENLDGVLLDNSTAVYKGVANGEFKVGLTFEEAAVTMLKNDKHIEIVYMTEGVVSAPDGIYIRKNCARADNAKRFVDFMTSKDAQRVMASDLGRRSVRKDVEASSLVIPMSDINSISVDKEEVVENKAAWLTRFDELAKEASHE